MNPYILIQTHSSYCPNCNKPLLLLHDPNDLTKPKFYVCFEDKFIAQMGVGEVLLTVDTEKNELDNLIIGGTFSGKTLL